MTQYRVTLKTDTGSSVYLTQGNNLDQVSNQVEKLVSERMDVRGYTVKPVSHDNQLTPTAQQGLMSATGGLIGCILILVVAEYQIRKWLQG